MKVRMELEIIEKRDNPLLKRAEIKFRADHSGEPTPKRLEVRAKLAAQLGASEKLIVIEKLASTHGRQVASGIARAYSSREQLEGIEPKYLLRKHMPKEAKPEAEKPDENPKPEKVEKPPEKAEKPEKPEAKPSEEKPSKEGEGGKEG